MVSKFQIRFEMTPIHSSTIYTFVMEKSCNVWLRDYDHSNLVQVLSDEFVITKLLIATRECCVLCYECCENCSLSNAAFRCPS